MPIYEVKVPGQEKPRMVKAKDAAAALTGIVEIKPISAERMIELQEEGVTLEKIEDAAPATTKDKAAEGGGDKSGGEGKAAGK